MNDKINYSGYVEMFLDSADDYEPYGYIPEPFLIDELSAGNDDYEQHREYLFAEPPEY